MAVIKAKPTSPGRRFVVKVVTPELHKGAPHKPLLEKQSSTGGRNNAGRVSTRHRGGGHKHHYRLIDFKRNKDGVPGVVERLEYDPNRSAHIALIKYADGERRYILAPRGVSAGAPIQSGTDAPIKPGNAMPLRSVPVGTMVHNIELKPGKGGQIARSAGAGVQLVEKLVFGRYCVGRNGDHFDLQEAALDWLITDARRQDLVEPSPQQKAMAELLGTDLTAPAG